MKVKQIFDILEAIGYTTPSDMRDMDDDYYSESRGHFISIEDMDLINLIRAFNKVRRNPYEYTKLMASKSTDYIHISRMFNNDIIKNLEEYIEDLKYYNTRAVDIGDKDE